MQEKLQKRQQMRGNTMSGQKDEPKEVSADEIKQLLDNDWLHTGINNSNAANNLVFSVGEKAEKTVVKKNNKKKNKKKKKKNKN